MQHFLLPTLSQKQPLYHQKTTHEPPLKNIYTTKLNYDFNVENLVN